MYMNDSKLKEESYQSSKKEKNKKIHLSFQVQAPSAVKIVFDEGDIQSIMSPHKCGCALQSTAINLPF